MNLNSLAKIILIGLMPVVCLAETEQARRVNPETGAITWETTTDGVSFSLTQILPDQVRAFYVNRGFTLEQIEPYALSCVYMTVLRNDRAPGVVHFIHQNWSVVTDGDSRPPMKISHWLGHLEKAGANKSARIAFRWAQFPPEHEYEPGGDWNQGMMSAGSAAGKGFDVIARWDIDGRPYQGVLRDVRCAH